MFAESDLHSRSVVCLQFSCASPSHSCPDSGCEVWVCNSDGYVGQVGENTLKCVCWFTDQLGLEGGDKRYPAPRLMWCWCFFLPRCVCWTSKMSPPWRPVSPSARRGSYVSPRCRDSREGESDTRDVFARSHNKCEQLFHSRCFDFWLWSPSPTYSPTLTKPLSPLRERGSEPAIVPISGAQSHTQQQLHISISHSSLELTEQPTGGSIDGFTAWQTAVPK